MSCNNPLRYFVEPASWNNRNLHPKQKHITAQNKSLWKEYYFLVGVLWKRQEKPSKEKSTKSRSKHDSEENLEKEPGLILAERSLEQWGLKSSLVWKLLYLRKRDSVNKQEYVSEITNSIIDLCLSQHCEFWLTSQVKEYKSTEQIMDSYLPFISDANSLSQFGLLQKWTGPLPHW